LNIQDIIQVKPSETLNTLKQLIDLKGKKSDKAIKHDNPAIILNAVSNAELNSFVHNFKTLGLKRPLFAVVTPTSIHWKFNDLIDDLLEEKAMFEKMHAEKNIKSAPSVD
jgi:hypothetical protein